MVLSLISSPGCFDVPADTQVNKFLAPLTNIYGMMNNSYHRRVFRKDHRTKKKYNIDIVLVKELNVPQQLNFLSLGYQR